MEACQFINPEFLIIIPVLYVIGSIIKNIKKIKDNHIPIILCVTSIIIALIYTLSICETHNFKDIMDSIFIAITQGFLCAGAAVLTDQIKKQTQKIDKE